ncbi:hypothetical protein E2C01_063615 [Portunus trituberculatus]|uniref:Uncharacterized protein n=1 Tax=Portunus trituberculatus TaxID=210409 RepID=A0A5B7HE58_PORTR|nr:hypothetical protein [Portunus trituberculatus]
MSLCPVTLRLPPHLPSRSRHVRFPSRTKFSPHEPAIRLSEAEEKCKQGEGVLASLWDIRGVKLCGNADECTYYLTVPGEGARTGSAPVLANR